MYNNWNFSSIGVRNVPNPHRKLPIHGFGRPDVDSIYLVDHLSQSARALQAGARASLLSHADGALIKTKSDEMMN